MTLGRRGMGQSCQTELWAITGGSGFLGLHLARRLLEAGIAVRSLDLEPLDAELSVDVEGLVGDVRDLAAAQALCRGADVVVHAAAALPIRRAQIRSINVDGTARLLAATAETGVRRVVFVSSAVVYGLQESPPATEETPPAPVEPYGSSKLEAESVCRAFGARGLETVILRPQAFLGPGRLGLFGILFRWIREGRRIYTLGSGANRYQLLAVEDLVDAIVLAAEGRCAGETLNLGAAAFGTVAEDLVALIEHAGSASRVARLPAAPARALLRALALAGLSPLSEWHHRSADGDCFVDCAKAEHQLGWRPRFSNVAALARSYDWYLARGLVLEAGRTHRVPWDERALGLVRRVS